VLGRGSFGTVYRGVYRKSIPVAVKQIDIGRLSLSSAEKELKMYRFLAHPHVIRLYGHYAKNSDLYLVLELGHCNLRQLLESQRDERLPFRKALEYCIHISGAILFLHNQEITHLDIKSSNVIICSGDLAKITDLGSARKMEPTATQSTLGKTGRGR
jgi:serine/threonine protein kinase